MPSCYAWQWRSRKVFVALALAACWIAGCQPAAPPPADAEVKLEIKPEPPRIGQAKIVVSLRDSSGKPLAGAKLELEGNMNHAGMKPEFADLEETEPGSYVGSLEFTMGGDWFVLVTGQLPDGRRIDKKIDVPGVETQ